MLLGIKPKKLSITGNKIILEIKANSIATTNTCPNNLRGRRDDKLRTAKPPAVVNAAAIIALPVVALILILTEAGALLIEALARSNDQQLAGAIIFLLTATIVFVNFVTDILLAIMDPRIRKGVMGGS